VHDVARREALMKKARTTWVAAAALLPLLACGTEPQTGPDSYLARLNAGEVVPPAPGDVTGNAAFTFEGASISFSAELQNLDLTRNPDRFLRLKVHAGERGSNGPPLAAAVLMERDIPAPGNRLSWQGRLGAEQLDTAGSVQEVAAAIRAGRAYVVVTHWQIGTLGDQGVAAARGQIEVVPWRPY
jgi:hypothetical protein